MSRIRVEELEDYGTGEVFRVSGLARKEETLEVVEYGEGVLIESYNTLIRDADNRFWIASSNTTLPYVTTGAGIPEDGALVPAGDAVLRQDLANPDKGAAMVARGVVAVDSIADLMALPAGQRRGDLRYLVASYHGGWAVENPYVGPRGGGTFLWHPSATDTPDGGVVLAVPGIEQGRFKRIFDASSVCVTWWGARGSGRGDDTDAFIAAEDFAALGETISVPAGVFPISQSLCEKRRNAIQIAYRGSGMSTTFLRWIGGAGRLVNAFDGWQYGFSFKDMTLETGATAPAEIPIGSMGFHIEFNQRPADIENLTIRGFDTGFDLGCQAQTVIVKRMWVTQCNVNLDLYGAQCDMSVFEDCYIYGGVKAGVLWSSGRVFLVRPFIAPANGWSGEDYKNIQIGIRKVRDEDVGKSPYLTPGRIITPRGSALERPRFEDNTALAATRHRIEFENFIEEVSAIPHFPVLNPQFPNDSNVEPIRIASEVDGVSVSDPVMSRANPALIKDDNPSGVLSYVDLQGQFQGRVSTGDRAYIRFGDKSFVAAKCSSMVRIKGAYPISQSGNMVVTESAYGESFRVEAVSAGGGILVNATLPAAPPTENHRIYARGGVWRWANVRAVDRTGGSDGEELFRMNLIPTTAWAAGISLEVPNSAGKPIRLYIESHDGVGSFFEEGELLHGIYE